MIDPLDVKLERVALAIGHLVINFAQMEAMLNVNLAILHQKHGNEPLADRAELSRRIESLREGLTKADISDIGRQHGLEIASGITGIAETRHTCIHSSLAFTNIDTHDALGASFDRMSNKVSSRRTLEHMFIGDIDKASTLAFGLTCKLLGLITVLDNSKADRVQQTLREMMGE